MRPVDILEVLLHTKLGGCDRRHLIQLHNALVISKLSYGSEIYSSATKLRLSTLNAVHHAEIRIATRSFRSSPVQSLLGDAGVLQLKLIRQSHIVKDWIRARRLPNSHSYSLIFNNDDSHSFFFVCGGRGGANHCILNLLVEGIELF